MERTVNDPLVGRRVGQYDVVAKLGGGGMGVVYTARDSRLGRLVALKFLPPQWSHDETAKQRFIREAQAASATDHRHICTIHDIETADDGQLFIVMAHYDGETLKQRLERGALPTEDAIEIAAEVAEGLAKAHAQGVVHRDIKPGNLMLTEDGIKILDFGLAKFADALQLTIAGSTLGTVAYMSPEQARAEEADARSDIWSAGVVLYEMLAGAVPFKGAYAEAIAHAIRSDDPPPIVRADGPIAEPLWQIVLRCLAKDPAARYQNARELGRDLRLLQGRTLPLDLLTQPVRVPSEAALAPAKRRWLTRPRLVAAALFVTALIGAPLWLFAPVERIPIVVVPVINQTGYAELDASRLALTGELIATLREARQLRVMPYDRLLDITERFRVPGADVSSPDALQAIATSSGARLLAVPTLTYNGGAWRARLDLRDADTRVTAAPSIETAPAASSLPKETAYSLIAALGALAADTPLASRRTRVAGALRRWVGLSRPAAGPHLRNLDAAIAFDEGFRAYTQQEYGTALTALANASAHDPRNPLLLAWRSRVARLMRRDDDATQAAERIDERAAAALSNRDRLFVDAVAAEARRRFAEAEAHYRELAARFVDDASAAMELGGYFDRRGEIDRAIAAYVDALRRDPRMTRAEVDLCRMYNRATEFVKAQEHARRAIDAYRRLGARAGEGQARLCLADALRPGTGEQRAQAAEHASTALAIFQDLRLAYNEPRALNYLAMIAGVQRRMTDAAKYGELALSAAHAANNIVIQPLILMNLGAAYALIDRSRAVDYYAQSYRLYEAAGDEARAAEVEANRGALLIAFGADADAGLREAQNALVVSRKLGNRDFEAYCLQLAALYNQRTGRYGEAERILNQALAIARERGLEETVAAVTVNRARSRLALSDYAGARDLLTAVLAGRADAGTAVEATIQLARTYVRLGDDATARSWLARIDARAADAAGFGVVLQFAQGELEYESGRIADARSRFAAAAAQASVSLPDTAAIEASAYVGLIDGLSGHLVEGRRTLDAALQRARGRLVPETMARLFLARLSVEHGEFAAALRVLSEIPADDHERAIGPELRAQVHYWRAQALESANLATAQAERGVARATLDPVLSSIPAQYRPFISRRPDIARIIG